LAPTYIDRQINDVYVGWADFKLEDIVFDPQAISEVKLVPFAAFEAMVKQSSGELAAVYQEECSQLVGLLGDRWNQDKE
jgi:isopentenyl-diphosphate Delta-isomerase